MNQTARQDIFDTVNLDIFDSIPDELRLKEYKEPQKVSVFLTDEIRNLIKSEIRAMLKEAVTDAVKEIKPHTVETKVIERVQEKTIKTPEKVIIRDRLDDKELNSKIDSMIKKEADKRFDLFIPAPPIIPNMSDKSGKVLSNDGNQLRWIAPTSGGSTSTDAYTASNVTTDRAFDADDTSLDELADVLGSLIASLQGAGIIQ